MTSGLEATADALTGGLIGRAIEPSHGEPAHREDAIGADGNTHEHTCLNCRTPLVGSFCHGCGQHAHIHRTIMAIFHDILHGVFHFEGKMWSTVPRLFWNPGDLTRRYIHGERAKFVSPLALFLFSVFLMFAVFESVGGPIGSSATVNGGKPKSASELKATIDSASQRIETLKKQRSAALAAKQSTEALDSEISDAESYRAGVATAAVATGRYESADWSEGAQIDTGSKAIDEQIKKGLKNPQLLLYKLQSSAYKFAWALIPLSLPFMWLMFAWKRQYKMYDHAVFVTYSLCFVMELLIVMALVKAAGISPGFLILLIPVHFYWQLKGAYQLHVGGAIVRSVALITVASLVLVAFTVLLLALGLSG